MDYIKQYADATSQEWADGLKILPPHMVDGMARYLLKGIPPGSFLMAVLEDRVFMAVLRADVRTVAALKSYVEFLHYYSPSDCFGSPEKVTAWVKSGGLLGQREAGE